MKTLINLLRQPLRALAVLLTGLLLAPGRTQAQNIDRVEFFVDTDPGYGNATAATLPATAAPTLTGLSLPVPLAALSTGFHSLFVRSRAGGRWGHTNRRVLYVDNAPAPALATLSRVEFFVDTDPGFGLASSVTPIGTAATGLGFVVALGSLSLGFHNLFIRTRDANGSWSQTQKRSIFVDATNLAVLDPAAAEATLYPSPTAGTATLEVHGLNAVGVVPVDVLDGLGREVLHRSAPVRGGTLRLELPTQTLPTGVYAVRVLGPGGLVVRRLVRE